MKQQMNLVRRRKTSHLCTPEEQEVQRRVHESNVRKTALFLSEGGEKRYIFGSDEFGLHLFPQDKYKWEKEGAQHAAADLKVLSYFITDRMREYTPLISGRQAADHRKHCHQRCRRGHLHASSF